MGCHCSFPTTTKSLQSCPTLCDPLDGSPPGSPVPGILQARTLEWVAISFSNAWKWKVKVKSLSPIWLLVTPWTTAYQAPPSMGFSRQKYWSRVPLPSLHVHNNKVPQTGWLQKTKIHSFCHRSRGDMSKLKVLVGSCSLWGSVGQVLPSLFPASDGSHWPLIFLSPQLHRAVLCLCYHMKSSFCVFSSSFENTSHLWIWAHPNDLILNWMHVQRPFFQNTVTFTDTSG